VRHRICKNTSSTGTVGVEISGVLSHADSLYRRRLAQHLGIRSISQSVEVDVHPASMRMPHPTPVASKASMCSVGAREWHLVHDHVCEMKRPSRSWHFKPPL
jgi:hypothetical protein